MTELELEHARARRGFTTTARARAEVPSPGRATLTSGAAGHATANPSVEIAPDRRDHSRVPALRGPVDVELRTLLAHVERNLSLHAAASTQPERDAAVAAIDTRVALAFTHVPLAEHPAMRHALDELLGPGNRHALGEMLHRAESGNGVAALAHLALDDLHDHDGGSDHGRNVPTPAADHAEWNAPRSPVRDPYPDRDGDPDADGRNSPAVRGPDWRQHRESVVVRRILALRGTSPEQLAQNQRKPPVAPGGLWHGDDAPVRGAALHVGNREADHDADHDRTGYNRGAPRARDVIPTREVELHRPSGPDLSSLVPAHSDGFYADAAAGHRSSGGHVVVGALAEAGLRFSDIRAAGPGKITTTFDGSGRAELGADAKIQIGTETEVSANVGGRAEVDERLTTGWSTQLTGGEDGGTPITAGVGGEVHVTAGVRGGASVRAGFNHREAGLEGQAGVFVGGEAEAKLTGNLGPVDAEATGSVLGGAGAGVEGGIIFEHGKLHIGASVWAACGVGGKVSGSVTLDLAQAEALGIITSRKARELAARASLEGSRRLVISAAQLGHRELRRGAASIDADHDRTITRSELTGPVAQALQAQARDVSARFDRARHTDYGAMVHAARVEVAKTLAYMGNDRIAAEGAVSDAIARALDPNQRARALARAEQGAFDFVDGMVETNRELDEGVVQGFQTAGDGAAYVISHPRELAHQAVLGAQALLAAIDNAALVTGLAMNREQQALPDQLHRARKVIAETTRVVEREGRETAADLGTYHVDLNR